MIKILKILLVLLYIALEEIAWNKIGRPIYLSIARLKLIQKFKTFVGSINNPWVTLFIFIIPFGFTSLLSLMILYFSAKGMIFISVLLYGFKSLFTIPLVIIFKSGKQQLLQFKIIKWVFYWFLRFLRSRIYRNTKKFAIRFKNEIKIRSKYWFRKFKGSNPSFSQIRIYLKKLIKRI